MNSRVVRSVRASFEVLARDRDHDQPSDAPVQAVVWAHGGPFCAHALEYFPLFHWLANLGFVVLVPHFEGSTSFGLDHMDAVRGDGCGVADLEGALAAGRHARDGHLRCDGYRVDVERGVAIAGHSWGGYLALLAATRPRDSPFSCAVASAGIADWAAQQRGTDVRYYDRWLMDGWVYEPAVAKRAVTSLAETSTMRARPSASKWLKLVMPPRSEPPAAGPTVRAWRR